jgi:acetyl esterase/lipase
MDIEVIDEVEYGKVGNRPLHATLYRPSRQQDTPLPAIVWIHGGAWRVGNRHADTELCQHIAALDFACFSITYRLSAEAIFPAAIQDCKCAVRYLRGNATELGIRTEKIGVWGPSAGGHLAALLGTSANVSEFEGTGGWTDFASSVQAVCDWYGPTDFLQMSAFPCDFDHDAADSPESQFVGGPLQDVPEKVRKANPISYVSESTPPFYIAHGKQDRIVPCNQSELLYDALKANGVEVTFEVLDDAVHGGDGFAANDPLFSRCIEFFKRHLVSNK